MWPLPFVGMLGTIGASCFGYSSGVFMGPLTEEFGWSRTEFSMAFTIQMVLGLFIMPLVGRLVDRKGARWVALLGIVPCVIGFAALAFANGSIWQWWLLCSIQALLAAGIGPVVWTKGIVIRFSASRGLAIAVSLAGIAAGVAVWPILAVSLIGQFGWRLAYPLMALGWAVLLLPLAYVFFREDSGTVPPPQQASVAKPSDGLAVRRALGSPLFVLLTIAGSIFAAIVYALIMHLVPMLQGMGMSLALAASLTSLVGIFGVVGRVMTGLFLDILPTRLVTAVNFMLPIIVALLLWLGIGSYWSVIVAVAVLGYFMGSESDIMAYLISRYFAPELFASLYSVMLAAFSAVSSLGPLAAAACFDLTGSYTPFLVGIIPIAAFSALLVSRLPTSGLPGAGR